jgi:L-alanine-DL-glutamate epimerase-like enolase superfamily enzyme
MKLEHEIIALRTKNPFIIARGGSSEYRVVRVTLTAKDGATGWGEAAPSKFYGETADTVVDVLPMLAEVLTDADGWSLEALEHGLARAHPVNRAGRAGGCGARHHQLGQRRGVAR